MGTRDRDAGAAHRSTISPDRTRPSEKPAAHGAVPPRHLRPPCLAVARVIRTSAAGALSAAPIPWTLPSRQNPLRRGRGETQQRPDPERPDPEREHLAGVAEVGKASGDREEPRVRHQEGGRDRRRHGVVDRESGRCGPSLLPPLAAVNLAPRRTRVPCTSQPATGALHRPYIRQTPAHNWSHMPGILASNLPHKTSSAEPPPAGHQFRVFTRRRLEGPGS